MDSQVTQIFEQQNIMKNRNSGNKDNARERGKKKKKESSQRYHCNHETRTDRILYKRNTYENRKFKTVNSKKEITSDFSTLDIRRQHQCSKFLRLTVSNPT